MNNVLYVHNWSYYLVRSYSSIPWPTSCQGFFLIVLGSCDILKEISPPVPSWIFRPNFLKLFFMWKFVESMGTNFPHKGSYRIFECACQKCLLLSFRFGHRLPFSPKFQLFWLPITDSKIMLDKSFLQEYFWALYLYNMKKMRGWLLTFRLNWQIHRFFEVLLIKPECE